ncbi:MAG TPA: nicotinate-nicotinamide nucleotide adenylyltransferase [Patescibacteria group bacterium]|nr:nicotinate-nicotinamide nucleotide adenylyltransferase [Patescibacteria group bacterium]
MEHKDSKPKVGIYSGTFDPVHDGHLAFCLRAIAQCGLDKILIIPEKYPRHKPKATNVLHRFKILEQAISELPIKPGMVSAKLLSSDRFTIRQTMPELRQICKNASITLLLGSDVALNLHQWDDLHEIISDVSFAIGLRRGAKTTNIETTMEKLASFHGIPIGYTIIRSPYAHLSSSQIRSTDRTRNTTAV